MLKNLWRTADEMNDKYEKRNTAFDDIEDFDDLAIKNLANESVDKLLSENGITKKQAVSAEAAERSSYDELANRLGIRSREFPWIWIELIEKCNSELSEDNIKFLLWLTAGGSFVHNADDELSAKEYEELSIRQWLGIKERRAELEDYFSNLRSNIPKYAKILNQIDHIKYYELGLTNESDAERVFSTICRNGFDTKYSSSNVLRDNLSVISQLIEKYVFLKPIKPLVYLQVFVRQQKKLFTGEGYIPNLKIFFEFREYGVFNNNEKNFDQYAEYCRLYVLLKGCFPDMDEGLCDTGFLSCSNLASWYHELGYLGYRSEIPDGIPFTIYALIREMCVFCFGLSTVDNAEMLEIWRRKYPRLYKEIVEIVNDVDNIRFEELGEFAEQGTAYCDKLFSEKIKNCVKNEEQHKAAWGLLVRETERRFDELLEQEICDILDKYYFNV